MAPPAVPPKPVERLLVALGWLAALVLSRKSLAPAALAVLPSAVIIVLDGRRRRAADREWVRQGAPSYEVEHTTEHLWPPRAFPLFALVILPVATIAVSFAVGSASGARADRLIGISMPAIVIAVVLCGASAPRFGVDGERVGWWALGCGAAGVGCWMVFYSVLGP